MHAAVPRSEAGSRRRFLSHFIAAVGAFVSAAVGIPIVGYVISPALKKKEAPWVEVGAPQDFQASQPRLVEFTLMRRDGWVEEARKRSVWVIRHSDTDFVVYNPRCTHLGCAYNWTADKQQFICPCHGGFFDVEGKVVAGPPPRPLDRMPFRLENGRLKIQYVDFHLGVTDKVEA